MLGSHRSLLRAVGTLLVRGTSEHHYLHFLYLIKWGALFTDALAYLRDHHWVFLATLPNLLPPNKEQAGTGHHHKQLASLPGATPAPTGQHPR